MLYRSTPQLDPRVEVTLNNLRSTGYEIFPHIEEPWHFNWELAERSWSDKLSEDDGDLIPGRLNNLEQAGLLNGRHHYSEWGEEVKEGLEAYKKALENLREKSRNELQDGIEFLNSEDEPWISPLKYPFENINESYGTTDLTDYEFLVQKVDEEALETLHSEYGIEIPEQNVPIEQVTHQVLKSIGYKPRSEVFQVLRQSGPEEATDLRGEKALREFQETGLIDSDWYLTAQGKATSNLLDYLQGQSAMISLQTDEYS